ncbi:MAG: hypothetical protein ACREIY_01185 [Candidatus Rokuibacteriota bacterium]
MTPIGTLERLVRRVVAEVRRRRAEYYALRGAFWLSLPALLVLLAKGPIGPRASLIAGGLVVLGAAAGGAWGWARRTDRLDAARLADRAYGLEDRVGTALEWADRGARSSLVDALVTDAVAHAESLPPRAVVSRRVPREGRLLPVPLVLLVVLALAPAIPLPAGRWPDLSLSTNQEELDKSGGTAELEERRAKAPRERLKPPSFEERDFAGRTSAGGPASGGDLAAIFKDTSLSTQRPDFNTFLKKGDDRLKMLEQVDRLPDLQSDFTTSQYKMVFRKSKALSGGLRPDQISPQKLRELLEEMERLGRKGGNWTGEIGEGMEALEGGQTDRALEAMQRALDKMRAQDEAQRGGKNLRGGRESDRSARRDRGRGGEGMGDEGDFGEGEGLFPGKGKSGAPKGDATARLRGNPYDVGVEGESRRGRKDGFDTNLTGRGGSMQSRLQYLGVIGQYRKLMEDAITRESVPRDYHSQIKDYFHALDER